MKLFVYGSLRNGCHNHNALEGSTFIDFTTLNRHAMVDIGTFPAAFPMKGKRIVGEVYEVDESTLKRIDMVEGYAEGDEESYFIRKKVNTDLGECYVYLWNDELEWGGEMIEDWLDVA